MNNELYHFGVKGMKWGVRRYEDKSGHLTTAGKKRYDTDSNSLSGKHKKRAKLISDASERASRYAKYANESAKKFQKIGDNNSMRIAQNQAKRYSDLSKKYKSLDPRNLDKQTIKELKKFNKGFFTDADYSYYEFNGHEYSTEDPSYRRRVQHMYPYGDNELYHFGVKGMKWGQRRYQNQDGSYTSQGRGRYDPSGSSSSRSSRSSSGNNHARLKKAAKIGAGVAAAGLAAYGGYRLAKSGKLNGLKALPNKRLALPGPKTSKVRNAASRAKSVARGAASKVGNSGVGRRVKRGVNSAQYHATRIKNEMAYRRATGSGRNVRSNVIGIGGPTYSKAGSAAYRVRRAASAVGSGARKAAGGAKRIAGSPVKAHKRFTNWAMTNTGSTRRNFGRGLVYGGAHGAAYVGAVAGAAAYQGRKANKRYKNANSNKKRR